MKSILTYFSLVLMSFAYIGNVSAQVTTGGNELNERVNTESLNTIRFKNTENARKETEKALEAKIEQKTQELESIIKRLQSFCIQTGKTANECALLDPAQDLKCWAKVDSNCALVEKKEGTSVGSCIPGYGGSCNYKCTDKGWSKRSNSCNPLTIVKWRNQKRPSDISGCGTPACGVAGDVGKTCYERFCAHRYLGHCDDHDYWVRRCETCVNGKSSISGRDC